MDNEIKKILDEIRVMLSKTVVINTCIVFYKQLKDIKKDFPEKYEIGRNFFNSVSCAYDYIIICELVKLFKESEQRGNLYRIISSYKNSINQNNKEAENTLNNISEELKNIDITPLLVYRDKYLAHSDAKYFGNPQKLEETYAFDLDSYEALNNTAIDILSKLYRELSKEDFSFTPTLMSGYDLYKIINKMN